MRERSTSLRADPLPAQCGEIMKCGHWRYSCLKAAKVGHARKARAASPRPGPSSRLLRSLGCAEPGAEGLAVAPQPRRAHHHATARGHATGRMLTATPVLGPPAAHYSSPGLRPAMFSQLSLFFSRLSLSAAGPANQRLISVYPGIHYRKRL